MRQVADRAQVGERVRECASCDAAVAFARPWPLASPALRLAHLRSHPTAPPLCTPPRRPAPGGHAAVVEAALRRGPHHSRLRRVGCARAGSRTRGRVGRRACCCSTSGGLLTTPPPLAPPILHPQQPIDEQAPTSSTTAPLATTTTTRRLPWARARRWARARGACAGAAAGLGQHACHSLPPLPPFPASPSITPPPPPPQAAKTYLERSFETFGPLGLDELVRHALKALSASLQARCLPACLPACLRQAGSAGFCPLMLTLLRRKGHAPLSPSHPSPSPPAPPQDGELTDKNCSVAVVGKDLPFTLLEDEALAPYIAGGCWVTLGCW